MGLKCGVCLGYKNLRPISQAVLGMIKAQVYSKYDIGPCPGKICSSCDKTLRDREKNGEKSKWKLVNIDIEKIIARRVTRATAADCPCGFCELSHIKGKLLNIKMEELGYKKTLGRPRSNEAETATSPFAAGDSASDKICRACKGVDVELQDIFNPSVLHILLGIVAKAIQHMKDTVDRDDLVEESGEDWFAPHLGVLNITESYYGGRKSLKGNDCHKVLQETEKLRKLAEKLPGETRDTVMATIAALAAFKDVVHLCFGERILGNYKGAVAVFSLSLIHI